MDSQSYRCECQEGFHGALCNQQEELFNPCRKLQCKHGRCQISDTGDAYCHCEAGYSGESCDRGKTNVLFLAAGNVEFQINTVLPFALPILHSAF